MAWAIVYYSGVGSREPQCGNINSFHASVFFSPATDGNKTYANKIINHTAKYAHYSFTTEQITANLTINSHRAVLQLIHFQNGQWIQVTYFCEIEN